MKQYLVQLNYKSGKTVEFWCKEFEIKQDGGLSWTVVDPKFRPLSIADKISDIESIWQIDDREVLDDVPLPVIEEQ